MRLITTNLNRQADDDIQSFERGSRRTKGRTGNPVNKGFSPMNDRRFIGSGEKDETIGRLLERTEALMKQNESFERTLDTFNGTMDTFGRTVSKLEGAVQHLSNAIDRQEDIDIRCDEHQRRLDRLDEVTKKLPEIEGEVLFWRRILGGGIHAFWKIAAFLLSSGGLGAVSMKMIEKWSK